MAILVVEDDAAIRDTVVALLEDAGYPVLTAANGREGLDRIEATQPSLVLLDMRMPVLDGWAFARELERRRESVPIVVMSAARDARAWAQEVNAVAYLAKPFNIDELLQLVERLTEAPAAGG